RRVGGAAEVGVPGLRDQARHRRDHAAIAGGEVGRRGEIAVDEREVVAAGGAAVERLAQRIEVEAAGERQGGSAQERAPHCQLRHSCARRSLRLLPRAARTAMYATSTTTS